MVFSHRLAALAAVVVIPLGIAATSFVLTDRPESPEVPAKVELDSGSPTTSPDRPAPTPSDEVVSPPPATDDPGAPTGPAATPTDPPPTPPGGTGQSSGNHDDDGSEPAGPGAGDDDGADDDGPGGDDG